MRLLLALLAGALCTPSPADAQHANSKPVAVAIPSSFPAADARALVVRSADAGAPDVILLNPANATPEALAAAISVMRRLRQQPIAPKQAQMAVVTGYADFDWIDARRRAGLASRLKQIAAQPVSRIGNLGPGRWIELPVADL